ncbi:Transmembrane 9 superfamily member [Raphanus sativus]|nr:Transmembrane 9 superfamily member [Raphanus sativus]
MTRTPKGNTVAKKQPAARKETTPREKALASEATDSGAELTSRQQVLAAKKSNVPGKRDGKSVAVPEIEESDSESADEPAPPKKTKKSKGKEAVVERDREKSHLLSNSITI